MMPLVVLGLGRPKVVGKGPQDARDRLHDWGWVDAHLRGPRGHWHHLLLDEPDEERAELEADPLASPGALRDAPSSATKAFMSSLGARFPLAICASPGGYSGVRCWDADNADAWPETTRPIWSRSARQ